MIPDYQFHNKRITSKRVTKESAIMAKESVKWKVGLPHWKGYGKYILL